MWQSRVKIQHYFVARFDRVTAFEAPYMRFERGNALARVPARCRVKVALLHTSQVTSRYQRTSRRARQKCSSQVERETME